jgi:signal transduction histidine kinase
MADSQENTPTISNTGTLPGMAEICQIIGKSVQWKATLDQIIPYIRRLVIFDNFALYAANQNEHGGEVIYARAVGRGKSSGEDLSWGDATATLIFESHRPELNQPIVGGQNDNLRLNFPYIIGLPILQDGQEFAIVFIRFGGPEYTSVDRQTLTTVSYLVSLLLKMKHYQDKLSDLELERRQASLQEDFISTISHELLSPIGFIKGYTTTLLRSDTNWNTEVQQEFLNIINEETDRLQELIDNLLDSARMQTGSLTIEHQPVRLDTLIRDVSMRAVMHQTNIEIENRVIQRLPQIYGDSRRLTQVFENIIGNAIKYAPGCKLIIESQLQHHRIHLTFSDNGPGIPARYLPNLFKKFYRSPESPTSVRGTGLGLYICRQIIEAHSGQIFAESDFGAGTVLHIVLPFDSAVEPSGGLV